MGPDGRRRLPVAAVATGTLVLVVVAAAVWWWTTQRDPGPVPAAEAFVAAWNDGDPGAGPVEGSLAGVRAAYDRLVEGLGAGASVAAQVTSVSDPVDGAAAATVAVQWNLAGGHRWTYDTTLAVERGEEGWHVVFTPAVVHPDLGDDHRLVTRRTTPERADIVGADGTLLVTAREVVHVGIHPARVDDLDALVATLTDLLDVDGERLRAAVEGAAEDAFVPVITLRAEAYAGLEEELYPLPGTVFRRGTLPLAPSTEFARPLLGRAGPVTAELLDAHPDRYAAGDTVGLSGLQRRYDERLFGTPGVEVVAVPIEDAPEGTDETVLFEAEPRPGQPVTITLEETVQLAADATLADIERPSALVAIRVSDGHVLAVANGPGTEGREVATQGRYAPGSTFKVVTTAALLAEGLGVTDPVACEGEAAVGGRRFTNAGDLALGAVPFTAAFAHSCNTTFVSLAAERLAPDVLPEAARWFGLGGDHTLGVGAFAGEVPTPHDEVDLAATAIGQGRVLASPLAMADVAATAARGGHLTPRLVLKPDPDDPAGAGPLPPEVDPEVLASLMRGVVTSGSGTALAGVPGPPVHGKTGTAEYGTDTPPRTHAWFIGYQGDLAFAVLVAETEDGSGGAVAAPVAAEFLSRLAG